MIVVTNTYIPAIKKRKTTKKDQKPIADTVTGDQAFYVTSQPSKNVHKSYFPKRILGYGDEDDFSESDDDVDDGDIDDSFAFSSFAHSKPQASLTGADWRPVFNDRMTMFIAGAPGAGKSYLAKQMINLLPSTYDILLFTALEEKDGNFDDLGKGVLRGLFCHFV